MQDTITKVLIDYGVEHGWSRGYIEAAAPDIAIAIIHALDKSEVAA